MKLFHHDKKNLDKNNLDYFFFFKIFYTLLIFNLRKKTIENFN
jgi:hypothetical protein